MRKNARSSDIRHRRLPVLPSAGRSTDGHPNHYVDAAETLAQFGVPHETRIVSAHRTPQWMVEYAAAAEGRGIQVIVAGAGGAAHLPGMVAANTLLPVLGVPVESQPDVSAVVEEVRTPFCA